MLILVKNSQFWQKVPLFYIILFSKPNFPGFPTFFPGKREIENREISREQTLVVINKVLTSIGLPGDEFSTFMEMLCGVNFPGANCLETSKEKSFHDRESSVCVCILRIAYQNGGTRAAGPTICLWSNRLSPNTSPCSFLSSR